MLNKCHADPAAAEKLRLRRESATESGHLGRGYTHHTRFFTTSQNDNSKFRLTEYQVSAAVRVTAGPLGG